METALDRSASPHVGAFAEFRRRRHFASLDGVRALSIMAVVWHHSHGGDGRLALLNHGFLGVDMFFVLSGFLIVTLLLRERDQTGGISLRDFYIRRTLRIFPIYYAVLMLIAASLVVRGLHRPQAGEFFRLLPYYATYTSNWIVASAAGLAITWSLATEEQFYLVWPACEKLLRGLRLVVVLAVVIIVNELISFRILDPVLHSWFGVVHDDLPILQATFTPLALGVTLAHLLNDRRGFSGAYRVLGRPAAAPVALAAVVAVASFPGDLSGLPRLLIHLSMAAFLGACVVRERQPLRPFLSLPPMRRIGIVSYGMYLYHIFVIAAIEKIASLSALTFVPALAGTYIIAEASYWFFERYFLALKDRIARSRASARTSPAAPAHAGSPGHDATVRIADAASPVATRN
jgi:peptidoglycan/LPS O-acetylase OafA/YrhL